METFIGRKTELEILRNYAKKKKSNLLVVTGRRRIGKSRLVEEHAKEYDHFYRFSALPPTQGLTALDQRNEFSQRLSSHFGLPTIQAQDWHQLFALLSNQLPTIGKTLILFDEISWMASNDKLFLPQLKNAWDLNFSKNSGTTMVLCGSVSSWIEKNILSSTGFVGRISHRLVVGPLQLSDCSKFWGQAQNRISPREKLKFLSVTGGVPRYLEELTPEDPTELNILRLAFQRGALLFDEFDRLFSDLFDKRAAIYRKIVIELAEGPRTVSGISKKLDAVRSGTFSSYLEDLVSSGFITKDINWSFQSKKPLKSARYRLSDNYLRFYLKVIEPQRAKIEQIESAQSLNEYLPFWHAIMGLQFENLVLANREVLFKKLTIATSDIVLSNPYHQSKTKVRDGCQIDLLIQTRFQTLYLCEIKFSKNTIDESVISEVKQKVARLAIPKNFSIRPTLIYSGSLSASVEEANYFDKIVNFDTFFDGT